MLAVQVGVTPMRECESCASNWLDVGTFTKLCQDREERGAIAAAVIQGSATPVRIVATAGARVRYVPCPVCKKLLNRENFGRHSGIIIDVCKTDGVWFERGELQSVMAFIDSGGFERARIADTARQINERVKLEQEFKRSGSHIMIQTTTVSSRHADTSFVGSLLEEALRSLFSS